jgi:hypothetical protein
VLRVLVRFGRQRRVDRVGSVHLHMKRGGLRFPNIRRHEANVQCERANVLICRELEIYRWQFTRDMVHDTLHAVLHALICPLP